MRRAAIGPFTRDPNEQWPLRESGDLKQQGWVVEPFEHPRDIPSDVDATIVWSPEYHPVPREELVGYTVACLGDWHIRIPEELGRYNLVATDLRGVRELREHHDLQEDGLLWFRMFSFDPRLHFYDGSETRDLDIAFMGRLDGGVRDELVHRVADWVSTHSRTGRFGWESFKRGQEAEVYRRAKIVFNFSQRGELNMRTYEAAACGALSVLQHDAVEDYRAKAPIPTYDPEHVEQFLEAWLEDDEERERLVARQRKWVAHERPVDHLGWLLKQVEQRLEKEQWHAVVVGRTELGQHDLGDRVDAVAAGAGGPQPADRGAGDGHAGADVPGARGDLPARRGHRAAAAAPSYVHRLEPTLDEQRLEVVALVPASARTIIDLGCGVGGVAWALHHRGLPPTGDVEQPWVVGVDASPRALETARQRCDVTYETDLNLGEDVWKAQPWYVEEQYDAVILADVLEHLVDPWRALELVKPLLAPGGKLVLSVPQIRNAAVLYELLAAEDWRYFLHGRDEFRGAHDNLLSWAHLRFFTRKSLFRALNEAGYGNTHWGSTHMVMPEWLERWSEELGTTLGGHGGDRITWKEDHDVLQWLVAAEVKRADPD